MTIETGDAVTVEFTGRLDDGSVFDTTRESVAAEAGLSPEQSEREFGPITIDVGSEEVIQGLADALVGQEEGATPTVTVPPELAYGEWSEDEVREFGSDEFTQMVGGQTPEEGAYLETQEGALAEIVAVDDEHVRVDFNHTLAGETLEFDLEIVEVN